MASVFTRVIDGELPGRFVWRDDVVVAFLDVRPSAPGHTLVVPRAEVDHWIDADPDLLAAVTRVAQIVGRAQHRAFAPERVAVLVAGFDVPHLHVHVIPAAGMGTLTAAPAAAAAASPEELDDAAERLRAALRDLGHGAYVPA